MQGVCSNAPESCRLAASKKRIRAEGDDPRCPECGSTLIVAEENIHGFKMGSSIEVLVPVFGLVVAATSVFLLFHHHPSAAGGTENKYPAAGGPVVLRLSGDETVGQQLAPSLVEAWLETRGAKNVSESATGPQTPTRQMIAAQLDDGQVQIQIDSAGDGPGFLDLASSAADIAMATRVISPDELRQGDLAGEAASHLVGYKPPGTTPDRARNRQPVFLYTTPHPSKPDVESFVEFALSANGQRVLAKAGFDALKHHG